MKIINTHQPFKLLLIIVVLVFTSCSKDSDEPTQNESTLTTSDFSITMNENPTNGQTIGTIQGTTNDGEITFSLIEESPLGALYVDAATGELKVANAILYDFESTPTITGAVMVTNGTISKNASIIITLNDIGDVYNGSIYLETQEDVNTFGANQYAQIKGSLIVGYLEGPDVSDIHDLAPLSRLNKVDNSLHISRNPNLTTTEGLNIYEIGNQLAFIENATLLTVRGFDNLTSIPDGLFVADNPIVTDLLSLSQINTMGTLVIIGCQLMPNIEWLSNVTQIEGSITIASCKSITNIDGLRNLINMPNLAYQVISISNNQNLENLNGVQNLNATLSDLTISSNPSLVSLNGLNNIEVQYRLTISSNDLIQNLQGLESITAVGGGIIINRNDALINLQGLDNLTYTNEIFSINDNDLLANLNGLNNLIEIWSIRTGNNPNLSDFCALQNVLTTDTSSNFSSTNNAYNPTKQDIIDGNCSL